MSLKLTYATYTRLLIGWVALASPITNVFGADHNEPIRGAVREIQEYANDQFVSSTKVPGPAPVGWSDSWLPKDAGMDPDSSGMATRLAGRTTLYINSSRLGPWTGTSFLRVIRLSADGKEISRKDYPRYRFDPPSSEFLPALSESEAGTLIPLRDNAEFTSIQHLYLLSPSGALQLVARNTNSGLWTEHGDIIANHGSHAASSELRLLHAPDFKAFDVLAQPPGYKKGLKYENGKLRYVCDQHTERTSIVETSLSGSFRFLQRAPVNLSVAKVPHAFEVSYEGGKGKVASMLDLPDGSCAPGQKLPAIVYIHGGNSNGSPDGQWWLGTAGTATDHLVLSQLGYVVLEANYFGDRYAGEEYAQGGRRYKPIEGYAPQFADIRAAGEYAKSLPCVDPGKIVLFGHSYGAILSSLLLTEPTEKDVFAGAILRGGLYTREGWSMNPLSDVTTPRLAVRDTEDERGIDPSSGYLQAYDHVTIHQPNTPITSAPAALTLLDSLIASGQDVYGVLYSLSDQYIDSIMADHRALRSAKSIPIFLMEGVAQYVPQAENFRKALATQKVPVQTWYPQNGGHDFDGETQVEMVVRIRAFVEGLSGSGT